MTILSAVVLIACAPLFLIDAVFLTEVLLGLRAGPPRVVPRRSPRIALLVPAHNEAAHVRASVTAMLRTAPIGTRALVVAHNCTDTTADEASAAGAEVLVLDQPTRRGKGYALAGGRDRLALDPPEVVIVIDADCAAQGNAFARLANRALRENNAVQAAYLFRSRAGTAASVMISNFAILVKNLVRQRGSARLGAPALLTGSGMAFPWPLIARLELATGNIVEDLALGIDLARIDRAPVFEEHAVVWSYPSSEGGTATQRARWEGGFLKTGTGQGAGLVRDGVRLRRWPLVWLGLHLLTPPLTLLLVLNGTALVLFALLALLGAGTTGLLVVALLLVALIAAVLAAWAEEGRDLLPAPVLARLPLYFVWKLALYTRIARGREAPAWIRTERLD